MHSQQQAYMIASLSRLLRDGETAFHGLASPLPMVAILHAQATHAPHLTYLNIAGSVNPKPLTLPHSTVDPHLLPGTGSLFALVDIFDLAARGRLDNVFLSGVQIDRKGRINMSFIGPVAQPKVRLPGGAGSAFLMQKAKRVLLWKTKHDRRSLVPEVSFCTASPACETYLVTPLCIFKLFDHELRVASIHPYSSLAEIQANTGWQIRCTPDCALTPPLAPADYELIERIDPGGVVAIEF